MKEKSIESLTIVIRRMGAFEKNYFDFGNGKKLKYETFAKSKNGIIVHLYLVDSEGMTIEEIWTTTTDIKDIKNSIKYLFDCANPKQRQEGKYEEF